MISFRAPTAQECGAITDLCLRSKAHWGYDEAFMAACQTELEVSAKELEQNLCLCALDGDVLVGFLEIAIDGSMAELEKLFVEPKFMGQDIGRALFEIGKRFAIDECAIRMTITADPGAEPFYARMGANTVGEVASDSIAGRKLSLMEIVLS